MPAAPIARTPHALVPLFPQFLRKRRRGFPGIPALLADAGISRPLFFLTGEIVRFSSDGATTDELRPGTPYATRSPHLPVLDEGLALGFLTRDQQGRYRPAAAALALITRSERETTAWLARQTPLPAPELRCLASTFAAIADGLPRAEAAPAAHVHRWGRIAALAPEMADAPLVRLERAIMDLWMARDDAHMAAWHFARFDGPHLDVITRLWRGDAEDLAGLQAALTATQETDTVAAIVDELTMQGYVEVRLGTLQPTRAGYNVREQIEADTDELYFDQWPDLDGTTVAWLHAALDRLTAALPDAPETR